MKMGFSNWNMLAYYMEIYLLRCILSFWNKAHDFAFLRRFHSAAEVSAPLFEEQDARMVICKFFCPLYPLGSLNDYYHVHNYNGDVDNWIEVRPRH